LATSFLAIYLGYIPGMNCSIFYCHFLLDKLYKILYINHMSNSKRVEFRGSALTDLRTFPVSARREAGYQLDQVQHGGEPDDWKPMSTIGQGVREIRIRV